MTMKPKHRTMSHYLNRPWTYETSHSDDELQPWTTRVKQLPGCMSHGKTPEDSLKQIKASIKSYILATVKLNEEPQNKKRSKQNDQ